MDDGEKAGSATEGGSDSGKYGEWFARELGPDWVEVEPGIFQPPMTRAAEPEPEAAPESLNEVLWPKTQEHGSPEPAGGSEKRGWWRRT